MKKIYNYYNFILFSRETLDSKNLKEEVIDFLKDLVVIIIVVLFIRTFLIEPFQISGQSMYPTYYDREFIIVDRFSYLQVPYIKKWEIERGDVIVFKPWVDENKEFFIKRVIGIGWDEVKVEDWQVYLKKSWEADFVKLDESSYLSDENNWHTSVKWWDRTFVVPEWKYFVMWDNRNHSSDSRTCFSYSCSISARDEFITKDHITWKVLLDLGYFNFRTFSFTHPTEQDYFNINWEEVLEPISTFPKWFSSQSSHEY